MKRIRRKSDEGVSAVIGTIMALMVFMFLFGMIQTQYVPVAMKDTEANHMRTVETQFGQMKYGVDNLILSNRTDYPVYTPVTMGSDGIPVFASPTPGILSFSPQKESLNISFTLYQNVSGKISSTKLYGNTSGRIMLYVPNRYYVQEAYIYTCGAVILYQPSGSVMKSTPLISIENRSGNITATMNTIRMVGADVSEGGSSTADIYSSLLYTYSSSIEANSSFENSSLWINITTQFKEAWLDWAKTTFQNGGLKNGSDYNITSAPVSNSGNYYPPFYDIHIHIKNVKILKLNRSLINVKVGNEE